jgi:hypothetical protein
MKLAIRYFALSIVTLSWAGIGFFYWIPLMFRAIALYTALVVISMIRSRDVSGASRDLDRAIVFWIDGFKKVSAAAQSQIGGARASYVSWHDAGIIALWTLGCGLFWASTWILVRGGVLLAAGR